MTHPEAEADFYSMMKSLAGLNVELFGKNFGIKLDYSERSLKDVDHAISKFHADGVISEKTYYPYIAYLSEVARRNLGGYYITPEDQDPSLYVKRGEKEIMLHPRAWVMKRFSQGQGAGITIKYANAKWMLGLPGDLKKEVPASEDGAPEPVELVDTAPAKAAIARGPILAFLMVAAADGEIDQKEIATFQKNMLQMREHPCQLFQAAITFMAEDFETYYKECSNSPIKNILMLVELKVHVETIFPDEAQGYFRALVELGERVAKASGGFFGFGSRIGKGEKTALQLLRDSLGVLN